MTRRSLVGPFILILIGALFLANNVLPEFQIFKLFSEYWPFLLIGWGVLRLSEILILAATSRPLPSRGLSGGEVALVVLICILGSTMFAVERGLPNFRIGQRGMEFFGETYDYPLALQKPTSDKPHIVFDNLRGNVRVTGADANEIRISGRKTIRAFNKPEADRASEQTPLEVVAEGDRMIVRTNQERVSENRRVSADLEVTVPRGSTIEGRGRYGDFDVTGIDGAVEVNSDNSGVRLHKIGGSAKIAVRRSDIVRAVDVKGNVEIAGGGRDIELENIGGESIIDGTFGGNLEFKNLAKPFRFTSRMTDMRIERVPGRISMDLGSLSATNLIGPIKLNTKSKDIKLEEFTGSLELDIERGDIELRPHSQPLAKIDARCRSVGNIELALPESAKFELIATTEKGEARNDFGPAVTVENDHRSATMKAKTGAGPVLTLTTARGSITVRKEKGGPTHAEKPPE